MLIVSSPALFLPHMLQSSHRKIHPERGMEVKKYHYQSAFTGKMACIFRGNGMMAVNFFNIPENKCVRVCACMCARMCACDVLHVRVCVCMCAGACMYVRVSVSLCACVCVCASGENDGRLDKFEGCKQVAGNRSSLLYSCYFCSCVEISILKSSRQGSFLVESSSVKICGTRGCVFPSGGARAMHTFSSSRSCEHNRLRRGPAPSAFFPASRGCKAILKTPL